MYLGEGTLIDLDNMLFYCACVFIELNSPEREVEGLGNCNNCINLFDCRGCHHTGIAVYLPPIKEGIELCILYMGK